MRNIRSERGAIVIEMALLLPFILLLIMMIVEFGFALHTGISVNNAASEAARYAAVSNPSDPACAPGSIEYRAMQTGTGNLLCSEITVLYQDEGGFPNQIERGDGVAVFIQHEYQTFTPVGGLLNIVSGGTIPATFILGACSDSRLEQSPSGGVVTIGQSCNP